MTPLFRLARAHSLALVIGVGLAITSGVSFAQNVQNFRPAAGDWNYLSVEGVSVAERGKFVPSLFLTYARNPLVQRDEMGEPVESVVENLTMFEFLVAASLHDRVEIGLAVPFGYGTGYGNEEIDRGAGLGDIRMSPKFVLRGAADDTGFGVALRAALLFPSTPRCSFRAAARAPRPSRRRRCSSATRARRPPPSPPSS